MTGTAQLAVKMEQEVAVVGFTAPTMLDSVQVSEFGRELDELVQKKGQLRLVLDMSSVRMFSSRSLGVLLSVRQRLAASGGRMAISGIDPKLYRVFKITNLQSLFSFFDTTEAAVTALQTEPLPAVPQTEKS